MERYSYQKILRAGNFGKAWLVRSRMSNRPYVIKEVNVACIGEKERKQAINEVAILARLRHVNIVRYREALVMRTGAGPAAGGGGGVLAIVMEYADGGDIAQKIEQARSSKGRLNLSLILGWFVQLSFALQYMHSEKILHRDLKPSNLFLTSKGLLKVGNFGIAKLLLNTLDNANTAIGTPYYLSPEICKRQPYNQKSDMWAAGCILYELMTLGRPFIGHDISTLVLCILHEVYAPIPSSYGDALRELASSLLSADPGLRPSAQDVLASPCMRHHVKCYVEQRESQDVRTEEFVSPTITPRMGPPKSSDVGRPNIGASAWCKYSPFQRRQTQGIVGNNCSKKKPAESNQQIKKTDAGNVVVSAWMKDAERTEQTGDNQCHIPKTVTYRHSSSAKDAERTMQTVIEGRTLGSGICHGYSVSEPERVGRGRSSPLKSPDYCASTLSAPWKPIQSRIKRSPVARQRCGTIKRHQKGPGRITSVFTTNHPNGKESNEGISSVESLSKKRSRRYCIPTASEAGTSTTASQYQRQDRIDVRIESLKKRRRRSLPERVRESKFLSRLVSSGTRPQSRSHTKSNAKSPFISNESRIGKRLEGHGADYYKMPYGMSRSRIPCLTTESKKEANLTRQSSPYVSPSKIGDGGKGLKIGECFQEQDSPYVWSRLSPPDIRLYSTHARLKSDPQGIIDGGFGRRMQQCGQKQVPTIHQSLLPSIRAKRPRRGSNAPLTCLFPHAPEKTTSNKPRSRIKHGTYTLNLPTLSDNGDQLEPLRCQRCGFTRNPSSVSESLSSERKREEDTVGYRQPVVESNKDVNTRQPWRQISNKKRTRAQHNPKESSNDILTGYQQHFAESIGQDHQETRETKKASSVLSSSRALEFPIKRPSRTRVETNRMSYPSYIFERENVIRRPVRHPQRRGVRLKTTAENEDGYVPSRVVTRATKPDVIPASDDVFLPTADNDGDTLESKSSTDDPFDFRGNSEELRHQMEVAGLLQVGMARRGELTTELRGKRDILKKYLERRIGPERTLVAYDIMSNAAIASGGSGHSKDIVKLVAEVIGPGKMKYFPILVQGMDEPLEFQMDFVEVDNVT